MTPLPPKPPTPPLPLPPPTPLEQFSNPRLRQSIADAIAGLDPGHGRALLHVDHEGAGVMVAERLGPTWGATDVAITAAVRYSLTTHKPEVEVSVMASW